MTTLLGDEFLRRLDGVRWRLHGVVRGRHEGEKTTREKGRAGEFVDYRDYAQGDEFKRIDWNVYGRTDQFYVREYSRESDVPLRIIVDTSRSMDFGQPSKFDFARRIAAAVTYIGLSGYNTVTMGDASEYQGPQSVVGAFEFLNRLAVRGPDRFVPAHEKSLSRSVIVVISDLWETEPVQEALKGFSAQGSPVSIIHVLSPEEIDPSYRGLVRFHDAETGEAKRCFIDDEERGQYKKLLDEHRQGWARFCRERQMGYAFLSSDMTMEDAVFVHLREGGILK